MLFLQNFCVKLLILFFSVFAIGHYQKQQSGLSLSCCFFEMGLR